MTLKTIEQIKKEIEELRLIEEVNPDEEFSDFTRIDILQALLQYSNEIIEEIDNKLQDIKEKILNFEMVEKNPKRQLVHYSLLRKKDMLEDLKSSIIGSKEKT